MELKEAVLCGFECDGVVLIVPFMELKEKEESEKRRHHES